MSYISPVATDANGQTKATGSAQVLGKDDFLQLLVTKLQYQDPLNPMEDEDYIAQLAQFSSLEQMQNIADAIEESNQWDYLQMQSINNTMASGLIGKEVQASYDGVYMENGNSQDISFTLSEYAENVELTIRNSEGTIVRTLTASELEAGTGSIAWDGTNDWGNRVDDGYYSVEATATNLAGSEFTPSLSLVGVVSAISYRDGAAYVNVNGIEVPLGDVSGVGEPGSFSEEG